MPLKQRKIILLFLAILMISGAAAFFLKSNGNKSHPAPTTIEPKSRSPEAAAHEEEIIPDAKNASNNRACDIFTHDQARKLLGSEVILDIAETRPNKSDQNVTISTCVYTIANNDWLASLLVRVANNDEGSVHDREQFGPNKPAEAVNVAGYGDSAYWNPYYGQLNILRDKTWYIVTNGSTEASRRTLEETKKLADLLKPTI